MSRYCIEFHHQLRMIHVAPPASCGPSGGLRISQRTVRSPVCSWGLKIPLGCCTTPYVLLCSRGFDGSLAPQGKNMSGDIEFWSDLLPSRPPAFPLQLCRVAILCWALLVFLWSCGVWVGCEYWKSFGLRLPSTFLVCVCCLLKLLSSAAGLGF